MTVETSDAAMPAPSTTRRRRPRRVAATVALALGVLVLTAGCSPAQMRAWWDTQGYDHSQLSEEQVDQSAAVATAYWDARFAEARDLQKFAHVLNDDQLWRLRWCESGGNYAAIGGAGAYRGAYQFMRSTWDGVARQHHPAYVGLDPAAARPEVQDAMARALWSMSGPRPWPVCGYRV